MIKHHRYPRVVILQAVYFKMRFTLGYWNVEELMALRGVIVNHSMIQRWVYKISKELESNMHKRIPSVSHSW